MLICTHCDTGRLRVFVLQIYLRFLDYEMQNSNECKRNFVAVYDGSSSVEDLKAKFCSTVANDVMLRTGLGVVRMWADEGSRNSRFQMLFTSFQERKILCARLCCLSRVSVAANRALLLQFGRRNRVSPCKLLKSLTWLYCILIRWQQNHLSHFDHFFQHMHHGWAVVIFACLWFSSFEAGRTAVEVSEKI